VRYGIFARLVELRIFVSFVHIYTFVVRVERLPGLDRCGVCFEGGCDHALFFLCLALALGDSSCLLSSFFFLLSFFFFVCLGWWKLNLLWEMDG
jgi:hypothetical protein